MDDYWKADLHMHSTNSLCSKAHLPELIATAGEQLDLFSITDHDSRSPDSPYLSSSYLEQKYDARFIPGIEITTQQGHLLVINLTEVLPIYRPVTEIFDLLKGKDVITIAPHPFREWGESLETKPSP